MDAIWFEDILTASTDDIQQTIKALPVEDELNRSIQERALQSIRGVVRIQQPRWRELKSDEKQLLNTGSASRHYLVRLGFEFDLSASAKEIGVRFISSICRAYLWAANANQSAPSVYDVVPSEKHEGEQRKIALKFAPKVSVNNVAEVSLGEISTDVAVGILEPACIGFTGEKGREPYWELTPKTHALQGIRHFWMMVDVPPDCGAFRLAVRAEAQAQSHLFGIIRLGNKHITKEHLPSIVIEVD